MKYPKLASFVLASVLASAFSVEASQKQSRKFSYKLASVTSQNPAPQSAPAQLAPAAGTLEATKAPSSRFVVGYYGDFNGPSVIEWGHISNNVNPGDGPANLWLYNILLLGYKLSDTTRLQVQPRIYWQVAGGQYVSMMDTRVGFNFSRLGNLGPISLDGVSAQLEVPTSDGAFAKNFIVGPRLTQSINANFGRWNIGSFNIQRYRFYANMANANWDVYFNPSVSYDISSVFTARLGYEYQFGQPSAGANVMMYMSDVKAQAVVNISNRLSFEPYVKMFPWDGLYTDNTLFGFEINGSIL